MGVKTLGRGGDGVRNEGRGEERIKRNFLRGVEGGRWAMGAGGG